MSQENMSITEDQINKYSKKIPRQHTIPYMENAQRFVLFAKTATFIEKDKIL